MYMIRLAARGLLVTAVTSVLLARVAAAQTDDHLKCYKIKDSGNFSAVINLTSQVANETGCTVKVKGAMLCVPVTKQVVQTDAPQTTHDGQQLTDDRICYKMKCPKEVLPNQNVIDQFGARSVS